MTTAGHSIQVANFAHRACTSPGSPEPCRDRERGGHSPFTTGTGEQGQVRDGRTQGAAQGKRT